MKIIIAGGSRYANGGVETFCGRAEDMLNGSLGAEVERYHTNASHVGISRIVPYLGNLLRFGLRLAFQRGERAPVVWLQYGSFLALPFVFMGKLAGKRVVVTPHLGTHWRSQSNPLLSRISSMFVSGADAVAYLSETQLAELHLPRNAELRRIRTLLPERIVSSPLRERSGPLRLVHASRLSRDKGSLAFLEVCGALAQRGVEFEAEVIGAGEGGFEREMRDYVERHELGMVRLLGRLDQDALIDRLERADVLVHLSVSDSYPLIVLEALGCGVYPICMELPGASEIMGRFAGRRVSFENPVEETVEAIAQAQVDELRAEAARAAGRVKEEFAWERCREVVEGALASVTGGARTRRVTS